MPNLSKTTRDHDVIRKWAEERGATPSHVKRTGSQDDVGVLRLDFPGYSGEGALEPISWEQFFEKFDEQNLALVYEEETAAGQKSNFNKLISAGTAAQETGRESSGQSSKRSGRTRKAGSAGSAKKAETGRGKATNPAKRAAKAAKKATPNRGSGKRTPAKKATAKKSTAAKKSSQRKSTASRSSSKSASGKRTSKAAATRGRSATRPKAAKKVASKKSKGAKRR